MPSIPASRNCEIPQPGRRQKSVVGCAEYALILFAVTLIFKDQRDFFEDGKRAIHPCALEW